MMCGGKKDYCFFAICLRISARASSTLLYIFTSALPYCCCSEAALTPSEISRSLATVYVVQHTRVAEGGEENVKLIGVYDERHAAEAAVNRLASEPGFRSIPVGFSIDEYEINHDNWMEGFGVGE